MYKNLQYVLIENDRSYMANLFPTRLIEKGGNAAFLKTFLVILNGKYAIIQRALKFDFSNYNGLEN